MNRQAQQRAEIAAGAARLMAEHGINDYLFAKRKAARELGLPDSVGLPDNAEVDAALASYHALYSDGEHPSLLLALREEALEWLHFLHEFRPMLIGPVADGIATEHSEIRIEIIGFDSKEIELFLLNNRIAYRLADRQRERDAPLVAHYWVDADGDAPVKLVVRDRPDRSKARTGARLDAQELAALIEASALEFGDEASRDG